MTKSISAFGCMEKYLKVFCFRETFPAVEFAETNRNRNIS